MFEELFSKKLIHPRVICTGGCGRTEPSLMILWGVRRRAAAASAGAKPRCSRPGSRAASAQARCPKRWRGLSDEHQTEDRLQPT